MQDTSGNKQPYVDNLKSWKENKSWGQQQIETDVFVPYYI